MNLTSRLKLSKTLSPKSGVSSANKCVVRTSRTRRRYVLTSSLKPKESTRIEFSLFSYLHGRIMIASAELTLKSGFKYQVEIHEVKIFQTSILLGGSFKMTDDVRSQLEKDAKIAGSWQSVQEMNIKFTRLNASYDKDILVKDFSAKYPKFEVIKEYSL